MTAGIAFALASLAAGASGFILNGSFEEAHGPSPYQWQVFVAPMEGAEATLDDSVAFEGARSIRIHVPAPYPREPYNNWSQNVLRPLAGERLELTAAIRTEAATRAEVWVQCFARGPLRELRRFSTADDSPVFGTKDWTEISMTVDVPPETAFLTVRCVLVGTGTAWFDNISLVKKVPPLEAMNLTLLEPPVQLDDLPPEHAEFLEELLKANKVLLDTVRELRDSNHGLARELTTLQDELRTIRDDVATMRSRAETLESAQPTPRSPADVLRPARPAEPTRPVPPLVPVDHELATRRSPR